MKTRNTPEAQAKSGFKLKSVSSPSNDGLKIKSIKNLIININLDYARTS